jgi:hypothetical protein
LTAKYQVAKAISQLKELAKIKLLSSGRRGITAWRR